MIRLILFLSFLITFNSQADTAIDWSQQDIPKLAKVNGPILYKSFQDQWPEQLYQISIWFAMVERETCISLTHSKCWSPYAGFRTSREEAFGIGQWTTVYGRFDKWKEVKGQFVELKGWNNKFDISKQSLALVLMNKFEWSRLSRLSPANELEHTAFTLVAHNSGFGGITHDRRLCQSKLHCDPSRWYGNVELYSYKSKRKLKAYGNQSFFEISRSYPRDIMFNRRTRYTQFDQTYNQEPTL